MAYPEFLSGLTLSVGLWLDRLFRPKTKRLPVPVEEIKAHGPEIAERRYAIIASLERQYGRDREYPSEIWMNRRLRELDVSWRVRDAGEYWETLSIGGAPVVEDDAEEKPPY